MQVVVRGRGRRAAGRAAEAHGAAARQQRRAARARRTLHACAARSAFCEVAPVAVPAVPETT